jgi:hypothetical protein
MFKNNVFKVDVDTKEWLKYATIRAVKTVAQTAVSMITVGQAYAEVNWVQVWSVALTAGIVSVLTSIAGIPEVPEVQRSEE